MKIKTKKNKKSKGGMFSKLFQKKPITLEKTKQQKEEEAIEKIKKLYNIDDIEDATYKNKIEPITLIESNFFEEFINMRKEIKEDDETFNITKFFNPPFINDSNYISFLNNDNKLYYYNIYNESLPLKVENSSVPLSIVPHIIATINYLTYEQYYMLKLAEYDKTTNDYIEVIEEGTIKKYGRNDMYTNDNRKWYYYLKVSDSTNQIKKYCINKIIIKSYT